MQDFGHEIRTYSRQQTGELVERAIQDAREQSGLPQLTPVSLQKLDNTVCQLAQDGTLTARSLVGSERTRGVVTYSQSRPEVLPSRRIAPAQGSGNQSLCRWHLLRPECDEPERHVLGGNSSLLIWSTSQAVIRSRSQRRIWNRSLPADFSRKSTLGIGRSSNIEVPAALGLLAARYVGNRPNPLCWNDPFPFQQGIEAIGCEVLERLNFPGRPADLQRLNLLCRP